MENTEQYKDSAKAAIKSLGFVGEIFAVTKNERKLIQHIDANSKLALSSLVRIKNVIPSIFNVQPLTAPDEEAPSSDLLADFREKKGNLSNAVKDSFSIPELFKALAVAIPLLISKEARDKFLAFGIGMITGIAGITHRQMAKIAVGAKWASVALLTYYAANKVVQIVKIVSATASLAKTMGMILTAVAAASIQPPKIPDRGKGKGGKGGRDEEGKKSEKRQPPSRPGPIQPSGIPTESPKPPTPVRGGAATKKGQKGISAKEAARRNAQSAAAKSHNAKVFVEKANERMQKAPAVPKPEAPVKTSGVMKGLKTFGTGAAKVANGLLGVLGVGFSAYDAAEKYKSGDVTGAAISGTSATVTAIGLGLMATGVAAPVGAVLLGLGTALSVFGAGRDVYNMVKDKDSKVEGNNTNVGKNLNEVSGDVNMSDEEMMAGPDAIIFNNHHTVNKPILMLGN